MLRNALEHETAIGLAPAQRMMRYRRHGQNGRAAGLDIDSMRLVVARNPLYPLKLLEWITLPCHPLSWTSGRTSGRTREFLNDKKVDPPRTPAAEVKVQRPTPLRPWETLERRQRSPRV